MASLQKFQDEIEEIHSQKLAIERAAWEAQAAAERNTKPKAKKSQGVTSASKTVHDSKAAPKESENEAEVSKQKAETKDGTAEDDLHSPSEHIPRLDELEAEIQTLILSPTRTEDERDRARDIVALLLTRTRGEHILRLGPTPPHARLFTEPASISESDRWMGTILVQEQVDRLKEEVMALVEELGGKASILFESQSIHPRASLLLRLPPPSVALTPEVRCAVVGNVDSGKSTTLGVLTRGGLDDGRGRARVGLFRHKHEIETGRTSSVGMEILGFSPDGSAILPKTASSMDLETIRHEKLGWEEISIEAAKIVSFSDLAGHEKYLKTTLYGLTSGAPACVILMVGGNAGLIGMSKEHLAISLALNVPVVVCITKVDMTPSNILSQTVKQVEKLMRSPGCRKTSVFITSQEQAVEASQVYAKERLCPIFKISNVTGEGLDYLRTFLNLLPSDERDVDKFAVDRPLEYSITEIWSVPYVGTVINGIINSGRIKAGQQVMIGPDANGGWLPTSVKTMQRKRANVTAADAGQSVSCALKKVRKKDIRKGMVMVEKTELPPKAIRRFEGQVLILYHNTTLQRNYQAMLHCGAIRQTVKIIDIVDNPQGILRTGDRAKIRFEFIAHPEFVKEGMKMLFREGKTKGLGVITKLLD